jgi:hypothetical protein
MPRHFDAREVRDTGVGEGCKVICDTVHHEAMKAVAGPGIGESERVEDE